MRLPAKKEVASCFQRLYMGGMRTPKILVVDDDQPIVNVLKENLEMEGYQVLVGFDGSMAIDLAIANRPDLLILDVNMPFTNGLDALTYLRKTPETQDIPVIFMTGIQSKTLYPVIDRYQRVAYLKKPLELEHLNSMIRQFLAKYPIEQTSASKKPMQPDSLSAPESLPFIQKLT